MISSKSYNFFYFFTGTLILLIPALSNNYPFVYSDTGTYIISGFENFVPKDRPIFYGWFIRHLSLSLTFWLPVIVQSFFTFIVIHLLCKYYLNHVQKRPLTLVIAILLVLFTGVGLFAGKLMPDIFTGLIIVAGFLLFFRKDLMGWEKVVLSIIFYYGLLVHLSNILMILIFLVLYSTFHLYKNKFYFKGFLNSLILKKYFISVSLLAILTVPTVNVIFENKFEFSRSSHVFLMGKMGESGILKRYLDGNCESNQYELCNYKNDIPSSATAFIWPANSILYKTGGWTDSKGEYDKILFEIYTTPKFWKWLATDFIISTFRQFSTFSPGIIEPHPESSPASYCIKWKMGHEFSQYMSSKQQLNQFSIVDIERRQNLFIYFSLAVICMIIFNTSSPEFWNSFKINEVLFFLIFLVINAFVCGALANVLDRLQGRVVWILPLVATIISINYLSSRKLTFNNNERV